MHERRPEPDDLPVRKKIEEEGPHRLKRIRTAEVQKENADRLAAINIQDDMPAFKDLFYYPDH